MSEYMAGIGIGVGGVPCKGGPGTDNTNHLPLWNVGRHNNTYMISFKALLVLTTYNFHSTSLRRGILDLTALKYMFNCAVVSIRRLVYGKSAANLRCDRHLAQLAGQFYYARMRENFASAILHMGRDVFAHPSVINSMKV